MRGKLVFFLLFSVFLLSMCRRYDSGSHTSANGVSCQGYTDYRFFEWRGEEYDFYIHENGSTCSYVCPDGTVKDSDVSGDLSFTSPIYTASKTDLDARFCGIPVTGLDATPTQALEAASPTSAPTPTQAASSTPAATSTPWDFPTVEQMTPTSQMQAVLTGKVTMCDLGSERLISFRTVQPAPALTGKTLTARIADQETTCAVNPTNPSLLTCALPSGVTFPAHVLVSVDGAIVNDFVFDGIGCAKLSTPLATFTP